MEFYCDIDQDRKVLGKKGYCPWKVMEFYCDIDQDRKVLGEKKVTAPGKFWKSA